MRNIALLAITVSTMLWGWAERGHQVSNAHPPVVDGKQLRGFIVAEQWLTKTDKRTKHPFNIDNYEVEFAGDYKYFFDAKLAPGERIRLGAVTSLGVSCLVTVDPKTMTVKSAEVSQ